MEYKSFLVWIISGFVLCAEQASAQTFPYQIPGSRYQSARALGMGDTGIAVGDDGTSGLFYNPANLGKIRTTEVEPLNVEVNVDSGYLGTLGGWPPSFYNVIGLQPFAPTLASNFGQTAGLGATVAPAFYMPGLAFTILMQTQAAGQAVSGGYHNWGTYEFIPAIGTGFRLADGVIRLGVSLAWVNEVIASSFQSTGSNSLNYGFNPFQGSTISATAGAALTIPIQFLPTFNFVARNFLSPFLGYVPFSLVSFESSGTATTPPNDPFSMDASFSITPKFGKGILWQLIVEYKDITNTSGTPPLGLLALGTELSYRDRYFLRAGWGAGYPSAGFGIKGKSSEFNFAWYSAEIGSGYLSQRDVRYMLQYQLRFP